MDLPVASALAHTMRDLLGCPVTATAGAMTRERRGLAGVYVDGGGARVAALWMDHPLAAYAGACLAMVPAESLTGALAAPELPENLRENVAEIFNVLSGHISHVSKAKLEQVVVTPPAPEQLQQLLAAPHDQKWLTVQLAGYGSGSALMVTARPVIAAAS